MDDLPASNVSFFSQPEVRVSQIQVGPGVPLGIQQVCNRQVGIAGAFGSWGPSYDNSSLLKLIEQRIGEPVSEKEAMNLSELGFNFRHHQTGLTDDEYAELEIEVGAEFLRQAAQANGWDPSEVQGVLIGTSAPVVPNFTERVAEKAGIAANAIIVSVHKACDGSVGALHLALNPKINLNLPDLPNLASELVGKKVLVGGIEGLSRFLKFARDKYAHQLFGNAAGIIGLIPGQNMKFLIGKTFEAYDEEGMLQVRMEYPHTSERVEGQSLLDIRAVSPNHIEIAGLMHEPEDGSSVIMAGPMGMVKLFVRNGVQVMRDLYQNYQERMADLQIPVKPVAVAIVHHANYKINKLIEKNLLKDGIQIPMPWLLSEFGNVSAASNMIAFLRQLPNLKPGDRVLFDGFGAGTYYDALAVDLAG